jgi:alpha-amylase/alpha-mannosidase (GH57 family)
LARVVFLWHMHQPDYRDPVSAQPVLPWVRLHSTRAYNDMAAALEPHERARVVVNWAPSLLLQLEAYAQGTAVDRDEEIARKPVDSLTAAERAHVLRQDFSADWDTWVKPVPRYAELLGKRGADLARIDLGRAQATFSNQELLDLQLHFMLAWMGFAARREHPLVAELVRKERGFTEAEKAQLLDVSRKIARGIVARWRSLLQRGSVELSCSPMFHPILPLLVDSDSARRAMPDAALPPRFQHPQDAREQVRRGLARAERDFGVRPVGMWPSEGAVSPEAMQLLGAEGVRWCATDQGNLERSELETPSESKPLHPAPWMCGQVAVFFRDRDLSDRIGFRYASQDARASADELLGRVAGAGKDATVTIALDGENAWERYPHSGELFLDALYGGLGDTVAPVLPREEIAARPPKGRIARIHSGSWIDSNFRIWIGQPEDNQAWTLLGQARAALERARPELPPDRFEKAYEAALAAEGSDWFWWYGDEFHTDNAPEFDALFRRNLEQIFRHVGLAPPERLARPIIAPYKDKSQAKAIFIPPRRLIHPAIDGYTRSYFEWNGAGFYRPGTAVGGSMYQGSGAFSQLWYGFSLTHLYLRLDPAEGADTTGELRILITRDKGERTLRMEVRPSGGECSVLDEEGNPRGSGFAGAIVELAVPVSALDLSPSNRAGLLLRLVRNGAEVDRLPRYGELELMVPDPGFEQSHWYV